MGIKKPITLGVIFRSVVQMMHLLRPKKKDDVEFEISKKQHEVTEFQLFFLAQLFRRRETLNRHLLSNNLAWKFNDEKLCNLSVKAMNSVSQNLMLTYCGK